MIPPPQPRHIDHMLAVASEDLEDDPGAISRPSVARARGTVFDADGDYLRESPWGPWQVMNLNWQRLMQGIFATSNINAQGASFAATSRSGTGQTLRARGNLSSNTHGFFAVSGGGSANAVTRFGFGNGSGTPTTSDFQISGALVDDIAIQGQTNNETARTITVAGSAVYGGGATSMTRVGLYLRGLTINPTEDLFLMDHSVIAATAINTGQVGGVTYQLQM